jgi:hypothetical protein
MERGRLAIDPGYLESVTFVVPPGDSNMGRLTATTAYRGTFGLHDGEILTSYATLAGTLDTANNIAWKLHSVSVDTNTGTATQRQLMNRPGAQMDAVEVVRRPPGILFLNKRQLVFGGTTNVAGHPNTAHVHFPDAPMVFTLFTGNLRRGRPVDQFRAATQVEFYTEDRNPGASGNLMGIFQQRTRVGSAPLMADGSTRVEVPAGRGVMMKLLNANGGVVVSMGEEHQFGPGEEISLGIKESLFNAGCGGCHGSVSSSELETATTPDVLTGASQSMAQSMTPLVPQ